MKNSEIAAAFDLIGDILEFQNANPFRVRAYRNASRTIGDLAEPLEKIAVDADRKLTDISGVGAELAEKIKVMVTTGSLPMLVELQSQVPASVLALLRIPGLGPKKAAVLHKELGIKTLEELKAACETQRVRELKGFGEKTEAAILAGMDFAASPEVARLYWAEADIYAQALLEHMRRCQCALQINLAGSYRRGRETIGDLDMLVESDNVAEVMDHFGKFENVISVLARGETKMSVQLSNALQVDLRVVPAEAYGAALVYFTGSKAHNVVLRGMAKDRGLKINEYGVFKVDAPLATAKSKTKSKAAAKQSPGTLTSAFLQKEREKDPDGVEGIYIAGRMEDDVYATLDLPWIPPELREDRWEFAWAAEHKLPKLIELADIEGDLHMHTTASDGKASLEEMISAAKQLGLKYIAITDHSPRVSVANGLNADRLRRQWDEIDKLNERQRDFTVLKGVEVDILERGGLDLDDDCLSQADWVVASVHFGQNQPREQITSRILEALANPNVCAIAHPTGRIINRRKPYEVDFEAVYEAALKHKKILELNSNPARLDLDDIHCAACRERGIPIVISTDAHNTQGLNAMRYGILQARRGGLSKADIANARPWPDVKRLLGRK